VTLALAAVAALLASGPEVRAVRVTNLDYRTALRVLTSEDVPVTTFVRDGRWIVIRLPGRAVEGLVLPPVEKPLSTLRLEREGAVTVLRIEVAPEVPVESRHEPGLMTLLFGEQPAPELRGPMTPDLYARLFPTGSTAARDAPEQTATGSADRGEGWALGRFLLRPYLNVSWVDADILAFDEPKPVRTHYLQVGPGVTASTPISSGTLAAEYEPRFRFFSNVPQASDTTHLAGVRLELPLGSRGLLRLGDRLTRATLETTVVDPGREYFYDLSRYTFNAATIAARIDLGPRLSAEGEGGWTYARYDHPRQDATGGLFGYDSRAVRAGIGYDLGGDARLVVSYTFEDVPPSADRAIVETTAHSVGATVNGDLGPLMTGTLNAGYRTQTSPAATGESRHYRGLVLSGALRRQLGRSTVIDLQLGRSTQLSAYEENAYYVDNNVALGLNFPLPFEVTGRGAVSLFRNDYPNDASKIDAPRRDQSFGWTLGLGRRIGQRAFLRADYRRDRRTSNVPGLDVTTYGFILQLGVGLSGGGR
jgi:hypothetical protein